MAGIKIHQYPLERTSIGDEDYYDIDYWTGSSYQSAKIKGSTLKNVLGANYIDITTFISGYELTDKDAGKLITNSNANVRTLVIPSGLALPNNMITVKGRIAIQPETGVNITLPDGSTITDPAQFTCVADEVYILHKSAFTGNNYILVSVKKSENIGTNDLIITDTIRELQVATDGTFQIVTNDANNSAVFKVGENSNERFSEIELNSITYDVTTAEPNPTNNGAGIITRINPNEYEIESRSDIGNAGTKRGRIYMSPNETILEQIGAGRFNLNNIGGNNTFEDLRATKKGLEYSADYSANFSVRSLVDKGYVDAKPDTNLSNTNLTQTDADRTYDIGTGNRTLKFLSGSNEKVNFHTDGGNPTIEAFKRNVGPVLKLNKVSGSGNALEVTGGNTLLERQLELNSVTNGFLMNRVTTVQMNGISSPATNLLVYNTDLNGIYRYNGSSWVALSSGYGIIGVYSGSGNGTPTFFATLQDALETCKASGGYFTVKLYSNITITSAIEIDYANSGVGNAYLFRQLTIDFNGFSVTNTQANTSDAFTVELSNSASVYQEIKFINGAVLRTNGTGTHHALKCDTINRFGTVQMSNMLWYCQNNQCARINLGLSTAVDAKTTMDLGGSVFVSGGTGRTCTFNNSAQTITNFSVRSTSSLDAFYPDGGRYYNFYAENTSSGAGILAVGSNTIISNFNCRSNSGKALDLNGTTMEAHNFTAKSTSGMAVDVKGGATATLFKCDTGNAVALNIEGNSIVKNAYAQNNSGSVGAVATNDANIIEDVTGVNLGASFGGRLQNTTALRGTYNYCTFRSIGGIGAEIISTTNTIDLDSCNFESQLDTSGGHACRVVSITSGAFLMTKCDFKVRNSGANCLNAASAITVRSRYSTHNDVASTPINANVTIVSSGIIS